MLRYMLVVLLYVITYCMAQDSYEPFPRLGVQEPPKAQDSYGPFPGWRAPVQEPPKVEDSYSPFPNLRASVQKSPNTNENSTPAQQIIYVYGPRQWKIQEGSNLIEKAASGYLITPGMGAHKLHNRKLSWNKARKACIEEGGHLAIINSMSEEKLLIRILEENDTNEAWLGIHDLFEENDWTTVTDESLEAAGFSKWRPNEPNNQNLIQHCGVLEKIGMDDRECTGQFSFFCEIPF